MSMSVSHTSLRVALFGSALALAATAALAAPSRADLERSLAATGRHASAAHAASGFAARHTPGWTYTVLHDFAGEPSDGDGSGAEVTLDSAGNIYGTTDWGGPYGAGNDYGALFKVATDGTESILHFFGNTGDGTNPDGAVTFLSNGNMIGTTTFGGSTNNGTIWQLTAGGTYSILYSFAADQGNFIRGRLVEDGRGNFYGTALDGGAANYGTVFKYNLAKNKVTVLHSFNGTDGEFPEHGVVRDKSGNLYGVTAFGGTSDEGTVYKIAKDGTFSTLYNFTGGADGGFIYGGLAIDKDGNLYGSADSSSPGSGTVFKLAPDGTYTVLYTFTGGSDGAYPEGDMLLKGTNLYSTATGGGDSSCSCGVIYEITSTGKEKVLEAFTPTSGNEYSAGLTPAGNGVFYGTTQNGATGDNGVVFSLKKK